MKFPCELLTEPYLVQIRRSAARYLNSQGMTQIEIAQVLGVSQPLVSSYIKRDYVSSDMENQISDIANSVGIEIAQILKIEGVAGSQRALSIGCSNCKILRQQGIGCLLHKINTPSLSDECTSCHTGQNLIDLKMYRSSLITDLNMLFTLFNENKKLQYLIPEIGLQIVLGVGDFRTPNDIAAFPGRIRKKKRGDLIAEHPTFGSSETLAGLLILIRSNLKTCSTIAAIKTSEWLQEKLDLNSLSKFHISQFDADYTHGLDKLFESYKTIELPFVIYNEGNVGYEDISYLICQSTDELREILISLSL